VILAPPPILPFARAAAGHRLWPPALFEGIDMPKSNDARIHFLRDPIVGVRENRIPAAYEIGANGEVRRAT
jgi:hypothetical protein